MSSTVCILAFRPATVFVIVPSLFLGGSESQNKRFLLLLEVWLSAVCSLPATKCTVAAHRIHGWRYLGLPGGLH